MTVEESLAFDAAAPEDMSGVQERIESLEVYHSVEPGHSEATRVVRGSGAWALRISLGTDAVAASEALGVEGTLADIYRLTEL